MPATRRPHLVLVDDDLHSAHRLTRMLLAHGAPGIERITSAALGLAHFQRLLAQPHAPLPGLVIVDLKAGPDATAGFISSLRRLPHAARLDVVAMAPTLEREPREALLAAGADAVFARHDAAADYRSEAASMVSYWVRHQRLKAVGS